MSKFIDVYNQIRRVWTMNPETRIQENEKKNKKKRRQQEKKLIDEINKDRY